MVDLMAQSALIAHRTLLRVSGADIAYRRKGHAPVLLRAIRSRQRTVAEEFEQLHQTEERWDWIVAADSLPFTPRPGDRIEERDGTGRVYEVLPLTSERAYEASDHADRLMRIHTKRTEG